MSWYSFCLHLSKWDWEEDIIWLEISEKNSIHYMLTKNYIYKLHYLNSIAIAPSLLYAQGFQ